MIDRVVTSADGRALALRDDGDPEGVAVLFLHGKPGSRMVDPRVVAAAADAGVRLVSYDRPGYGGSDRDEGRSVASAAGDVQAIATALRIGRLGLLGHSGGGPHALAAAALNPDLVAATVALASPAPYSAQELDWFAGPRARLRPDVEQLLNDPPAARAHYERERALALRSTPGQVMAARAAVIAPIDAGYADPEYFHAQLLLAFAAGADGKWDDDVAFLKLPWGFDLAAIKTPVRLRYGRQDQTVPLQHGQWLSAHTPSSELIETADDGHTSLLRHAGTDLAWLRSRL